MNDILKSCPFCGGPAECTTPGWASEHQWFKNQVVRNLYWRAVKCAKPSCPAHYISCSSIEHSVEEAEEKSAKEWNTRA